MYFFFMDETFNQETKPEIVVLTGLLVPEDRYGVVREQVYAALRSEIQPKPSTVNLSPCELHFSKFMKHLSDPEKVRLQQTLCQIVAEQTIQVYRMGYSRLPDRSHTLYHQLSPQALLSMSWSGLIASLSPILELDLVLPVMDAGFGDNSRTRFEQGFYPSLEGFSGAARSLEIIRAVGLEQDLRLANTGKLGEVVYVDSRYSVLMQLTDVVAGLRRIRDTYRITGQRPKSEYKSSLLDLAAELDSVMAVEQITSITVV